MKWAALGVIWGPPFENLNFGYPHRHMLHLPWLVAFLGIFTYHGLVTFSWNFYISWVSYFFLEFLHIMG